MAVAGKKCIRSSTDAMVIALRWRRMGGSSGVAVMSSSFDFRYRHQSRCAQGYRPYALACSPGGM